MNEKLKEIEKICIQLEEKDLSIKALKIQKRKIDLEIDKLSEEAATQYEIKKELEKEYKEQKNDDKKN